MRRIRQLARGMAMEWHGARRTGQGARSVFRLAVDVLLYRVIKVLPGLAGRERHVTVGGGLSLRYRLNRGDIQGVREVFYTEAYRLPVPHRVRTLVDLGANIGLTSLWLRREVGYEHLVAVEPVAANADLVRRNLADNGIAAEVVEAAVGPEDGTIAFTTTVDSNLGHAGEGDLTVPMVSMGTVLGHLPPDARVDLLKMDIEGGEQPVLDGDLTWLERVDAIVAEFHPEVVDHPGLVDRLVRAGFRYYPAGSVHPDAADFFIRPELVAEERTAPSDRRPLSRPA